MNPLKTPIIDRFILGGWLTIVFSALLFCLPIFIHINIEGPGFFIIHFAAVIAYHFVLYFNKDSRNNDHMIHYRLIKLVLLLISAYALNREMEVFAASPIWFSVLLVIISVNYLTAIVFKKLPRLLQYFSFGLHGIAFVVFLYLSFYLLPLYIISVPGLLFFGISLHAFVPALFCIVTVSLIQRLAKDNNRYWISFTGGIVGSVLLCIAFIVAWDNKLHTINRQYTAAMMEGEDKLPLWVQVAQAVERDGITESILKTNLTYKIPAWNDNLFFSMPSRNFGDEQQVHDPLVTLASIFSGKVLLSEADRVKILESQYNARHQALERLWSGEQLKTEQVSTNVKLWPAMHLAYTEKTLTVYNHQNRERWRSQGEGIYTFHLPEGAVVTALSLWINGREEKGILTTKEKATTAYRTIVGYERRDPSVVHWQEGNTVSVRVFPVMAGESRTFKIGVTAPLRKEAAHLVYDNIWFDGPDAGSAEETVKLQIEDDSNEPLQNAALKSNGQKLFTRNGGYQARWQVAFKDEGIRPHSFSFNGNQYSLQKYYKRRVPVNVTDVYLDVNEAWSAGDIEQVYKLSAGKKIWVYNGSMQLVNEENKDELFQTLTKQSFSLFPFHLVANPAQSVVVSKSGSYSPTIKELDGSPFLKSLQEKLSGNNRVKVFGLGSEMSPFIRSLKEQRYFDFEQGEISGLEYLLKHNLFIEDAENDSAIVVHSADVVITKQSGEATSNAPDHLMRLFAYNHILQQMGRNDSSATDTTALVKEAEEAYVVSPVSSLVVLESQTDYDRFDIKQNGNSLKNASMSNNGAVPEPAEWLIIILAGTAFLLFVYKTKIA